MNHREQAWDIAPAVYTNREFFDAGYDAALTLAADLAYTLADINYDAVATSHNTYDVNTEPFTRMRLALARYRQAVEPLIWDEYTDLHNDDERRWFIYFEDTVLSSHPTQLAATRALATALPAEPIVNLTALGYHIEKEK